MCAETDMSWWLLPQGSDAHLWQVICPSPDVLMYWNYKLVEAFGHHQIVSSARHSSWLLFWILLLFALGIIPLSIQTARAWKSPLELVLMSVRRPRTPHSLSLARRSLVVLAYLLNKLCKDYFSVSSV